MMERLLNILEKIEWHCGWEQHKGFDIHYAMNISDSRYLVDCVRKLLEVNK